MRFSGAMFKLQLKMTRTDYTHDNTLRIRSVRLWAKKQGQRT
jgi:hypothetical protein